MIASMPSIVEPIRFELPPELEAREPPEARGIARDEVRLLVSDRNGGVTIGAQFRDLPMFLESGDLVVVNDSATMPAALVATRRDGTTFALHLSQYRDGVWTVEPRHTTVCAGERVALPGDGHAIFGAPHAASTRLWRARLELPAPLGAYLATHGKPIAYSYVRGAWPIEMYQTVYAREPGSAEMPSAGRAFSGRVLDELRARGVGVAAITLHTGVASLESHEAPYEEWYRVTAEAAGAVNETRRRGGRVIATGTTVVRALESAANAAGEVCASSGWTELVITSDRGVRTVDALITGFHEPRASHLWMLEAIAGRRQLQRAYDAALRGRYLWHEFGDLHLVT
jgi:S-adenosylmethionine:tRNA ribosyltransferase-isomerase